MSKETIESVKARFATIEELQRNVLPAFVAPVPCSSTVRTWLDKWRVRSWKANENAARGGGPRYFYVADVEKMLRNRMGGN